MNGSDFEVTSAGIPGSKRIILLGASNLTRGISTVLETAWELWDRPLEVLAALGHGRSFGMKSSILGRALPGILESGLWDALDRLPLAPTAALVTDIGNDLLYGMSPEQLGDWVEECLDRLERVHARVVMTLPPAENIDSLSAWRFLFFRTLFVPSCRLSLAVIKQRVFDSNQRLRNIALERKITLVENRTQWYGLDPLHIKRRHWAAAWMEILRQWQNQSAKTESDSPIGQESAPATQPKLASGSLARWIYLRSQAPQQRWLLGIEQCKPQPSGRLPDGTTIALY